MASEPDAWPRIELPRRRQAFELRGELAGGQTRPLMVSTYDDEGVELVVALKLRRPHGTAGHFGPTSLACELICSALARLSGLRVPDYFVVEVSEQFARSAPIRWREILLANIGASFGSAFLEGMQLWNSENAAFAEGPLQALEDTLAFDAAVINGDRKVEKPNLLWQKDEFVLIDHSLALPLHLWEETVVTSSPLFPDGQMKAHCVTPSLRGKRRRFEAFYATWVQRVTGPELERLRGAVPREWEHAPGTLDRIFDFLGHRPVRFHEQSGALQRVVS